MSPSHLSHVELAEHAARPFHELSPEAQAHLAQCTHCAVDFAEACEAHAHTQNLVAIAAAAGWRPAAPSQAGAPWRPALGLALAVVLALYTAPSWSMHLATLSLVKSAHFVAGGAHLAQHLLSVSPLFFLPVAALVLLLSRPTQGVVHA